MKLNLLRTVSTLSFTIYKKIKIIKIKMKVLSRLNRNVNKFRVLIITILKNLNVKVKYFRGLVVESDLKYSILFGLILERLNIDLDNLPVYDDKYLYSFALGNFILSLIGLLCFINVLCYLLSIVIIKKYDIESKFPKLSVIIRYYENSSLLFVIIEGIICLCVLIFIVVMSLFLIITNKM